MANLTPVFLTVHIVTAIGAFGPSFAFPLMARMAAREDSLIKNVHIQIDIFYFF
jgi:hypothetical protein